MVTLMNNVNNETVLVHIKAPYFPGANLATISYYLSRPKAGTTINLFTTAKKISNMHMGNVLGKSFLQIKISDSKTFLQNILS